MARNKARDQKKILSILEEMPIVIIACQRAGLPTQTYYRWCKEDADFAIKADQARYVGEDRVNDLAQSKLIQLISESHLPAIMYWLNNKHRDYTYPKVLPIQREKPIIREIGLMGTIEGPDER